MTKIKSFGKIIYLKKLKDSGNLSEEKINEYKSMLQYSELSEELVTSVVNDLGYNKKSTLSIGISSFLNKEPNKMRFIALLLVLILAIYLSNKENTISLDEKEFIE